ncbi:MAG: DNA recombination protein RmuC [Bacteroidaceae bacterium]|nr:DNA recombination protein RmuC [Bacteroidaceae bacterium]
MEIAIIILALLLLILSYLLFQSHGKATKAETQVVSLQEQQETLKQSSESVVQNLKDSHKKEMDELKVQYLQMLEHIKSQFQETKADMEKRHDLQKQEMQKQWEEKINTMRLEFDRLSSEHLKMQQESMKATNVESMDNLLNPLKESLAKFQKEFEDKMTEQGKTDAVMKEAINTLTNQTMVLGENADNLAKALKADPKKQGNWGEAVLKNILEASGMTEGTDFFTQDVNTDDNGNRFIPDVKVKLHGDSYLIIDSKTSITAYLDYIHAETAEEQERHIKEHIKSIRTHVNELADKHYPKKVENSAEYVLMFIPNEGSYILAMENDAKLATDAYQKHIIIVNPTNLMLALKIVWLFWQNAKQTKNVKDIIESAQKVYKKFATFTDTFSDLGTKISAASSAFDKAQGQLSTGPGNIVKQLESWKDKGVIPEKEINKKLLENKNEE